MNLSSGVVTLVFSSVELDPDTGTVYPLEIVLENLEAGEPFPIDELVTLDAIAIGATMTVDIVTITSSDGDPLQDVKVKNGDAEVVNFSTKAACKNDGWEFLNRPDDSIFDNQGDCIQYVNTGE